MGNTTNDNACEWLIQHPQVDDHEVDWAREVIVEQQAEIDDYRALIKDHADMHPVDRIKFTAVLNKHRGK